MKEFINILIGNVGVVMFAALFFFALIGVSINLLFHANTRDQSSPNTPKKFSVSFLISDNWKRILLAILLIYVSIRFVQLIFTISVENNNELYLFSAVFIGFIFDKLGEFMKKKFDFFKSRVENAA